MSALSHNFLREELLSEDGGVIVLDWCNRDIDSRIPTIVVVPGTAHSMYLFKIEGVCSHSDSQYVRGWVHNITAAGFRAVVYNPRGCVSIKVNCNELS